MTEKELLELEELANHFAEKCYKIRMRRGRIHANSFNTRKIGLTASEKANLLAKRNAHIKNKPNKL